MPELGGFSFQRVVEFRSNLWSPPEGLNRSGRVGDSKTRCSGERLQPGPRSHLRRNRYPEGMPEITMTPETLALRELLDTRRGEFQVLLDRYGATGPKLFGSVARGTASSGSDIDILVEMDPAGGNLLMRASGLMEETRELFGRDDIDVFPVQLLKRPVSDSALNDAVAL